MTICSVIILVAVTYFYYCCCEFKIILDIFIGYFNIVTNLFILNIIYVLRFMSSYSDVEKTLKTKARVCLNQK